MIIELLISESGNRIPGSNVPKTVTPKEVKAERSINNIRDQSIVQDTNEERDKLSADHNKRMSKAVMSDFRFGTSQKGDKSKGAPKPKSEGDEDPDAEDDEEGKKKKVEDEDEDTEAEGDEEGDEDEDEADFADDE
ncbi:MAG: hypothetical protein ACRC6V_03865 [Bacteroidales bacterium]